MRRACTPDCTDSDLPAPSQQPPLHLAASRPLCTSPPPAAARHPPPPIPRQAPPLPCAAPLGCNCPLGSARGGRVCRRACARVCVRLCVCVWEAWVLVACLSALQCFLTFFSFSHIAFNKQVLPKVCTSTTHTHTHCCPESDLFCTCTHDDEEIYLIKLVHWCMISWKICSFISKVCSLHNMYETTQTMWSRSGSTITPNRKTTTTNQIAFTG